MRVLTLHLPHSTSLEWEKLSPLSSSERNLSSHSLGDGKKEKLAQICLTQFPVALDITNYSHLYF